MSTCSTYCATPFPDHTNTDCGDTVGGGVQNLVLFSCQSVAVENDDYTTATINSDIANGYATMVLGIKGSSAAGSPNANSASYVAGGVPKVGSYTIDFALMDENFSIANDTAWGTLNSTSGTEIAAILGQTVGETAIAVLYKPLSSFQLIGTAVVPDSEDDVIHYEFNVSGKSRLGPVAVAMPVALFP